MAQLRCLWASDSQSTVKDGNIPESSPEINDDLGALAWYDGKGINEALFCSYFLRDHQLLFSGGSFFTTDGRVTDETPLRRMIFEELKICATANIPRKITNIVELLKLEALSEDFAPDADRIHLANGTLSLDGTFVEGKPEIVRNRLPIAYHPAAHSPEIWLSFLDSLLYPEDIPTLQEFIGYCLIPSNKAQRMMILKGSGGEGKSQIGAVLSALFGRRHAHGGPPADQLCEIAGDGAGKNGSGKEGKAELPGLDVCPAAGLQQRGSAGPL